MSTSTIFKVNDIIKNRKTGKIGIVTKVYEEVDLIRYHLIGTPNCGHIFSARDERFDIIKGEQMKIRVYLDTAIEVFNYKTNADLFTAVRNFEHYNFRWEFV